MLPTEAEVLEYFDSLSNWNRWGADDVLGTLNLISDEKRVEASRLVRHGRMVSCAWDIDTNLEADDVTGPPQRWLLATGQGLGDEHRQILESARPTDRHAVAAEFLGMFYHGYRITHIDALSHIFWDHKMYNGVPAEFVSASHGARSHAVTNIRTGIITRGVLLDVPRHRGVDWLEPGEFVTPDEIEAVLRDAGVDAGEGDALLLRTGYGRRRLDRGPDHVHQVGRAGWHASCLPWFHERGIALIAADTATDASPSGYQGIRLPVHMVGIAAMGLWLLDNCNLEAVSTTCEELNTAECELIVAPLPFAGATGSPVNPLAVF